MTDMEHESVLYSVIVKTGKGWFRRSFSDEGGRAAGACERARHFAEQARAREAVIAVFFTRWDRNRHRWVDVDE